MKKALFLLISLLLFQGLTQASDLPSQNMQCKKLKKNYKICKIKTNIKDERFEYIIEKVIFKCPSKEFRILSLEGYNKSDEIIYTDKEPIYTKDAIEKNMLYKIVKDSMGESWYKKACHSK